MKNPKINLSAWIVALALSLLLALWASMPVNETAAAKVSVITLKESAISSIDLLSGEVSIHAERQRPANDQWWILSEKKTTSASNGAAQGDVVRERFKASAKFKDFLAQFAPLQAIRVIGNAADDKLSEFGLKGSSRTLVVKDSDGRTLLALTLGKQLYGARNMYALNQADQKVLLITGDLINDFEKPELRFFERAITSIDSEEIQAATLTQGGKSKRFSHSSKDAKGAQIWTADGGSGAPVPQASSWFDRFMQVKAASYPLQEDEVALSKVPAIFEVRLEGPGSTVEVLQMKRRPGPSGAEYWLHSSYLNWHVKVAATRAETLEKDVPQILSD